MSRDDSRQTSTTKRNRSKQQMDHRLEIPSPREIVDYLDEIVVGQSEAKKRLAVGVTNHFKRLSANDGLCPFDMGDLAQVTIQKNNILLMGPTGSGKTFLAQSLAEKLNVPFAIADATSFTEAGYVGDDVENALLRLLAAAEYDIEEAQRGVIYIDEIDKIRKSSGNVSITKDVSGEGVQQALLKMIEGIDCNVPLQGGRKHPDQECIQIDTTNILFICGGAFVGLDEVISQRLGRRKTRTGNPLSEMTAHDLVKFGLIPEFVGRLPVVVGLDKLGLNNLISILTEPRDAVLKQYRKLCLFDGVEFDFTREALRELASRAMTLGTGARGLRWVVESMMTDIMYELSSKEPGLRVLSEAVPSPERCEGLPLDLAWFSVNIRRNEVTATDSAA
ncbi:ATP-dependent Clp protease ATP-binding subunit ClpX [Gimesia aquarii]|uniref:ATP-dependent Clp protease ATP-binding subunit ClpX n=1 Tax=Gimesia aquarii TaxID=2527964 RepID=A0A517VQI8_9PLAN|nr:ATP-dependent Clp protease ATP-binding subunit ClpX [Gimesia aquarii]QDT95291.1 ATP-dependent Clp protease ATP-binding subunit ClpX [Gimesia aquarii]